MNEDDFSLCSLNEDFIEIFTDGSHDIKTPNSISGWGCFCIGRSANNGYIKRIYEACGPVVVDVNDQQFCGADKHSNNAAEYTGLLFALRFALDSADYHSIFIRADSKLAIDAVLNLAKISLHKTIIVECQKMLKQILDKGINIKIAHTYSHTGCYGNEYADKLAKKGCKYKYTQSKYRSANLEEADLFNI